MLTRHIYRSSPARLCTPALRQTSVPIARCRYASSNKSVDQQRHAKDDKVKPTTPTEKQPKQTRHKLTAKERDDMMMQKLKERMGQEGDAAWEDGRPAESGLPRNVKNNMFSYEAVSQPPINVAYYGPKMIKTSSVPRSESGVNSGRRHS